MIMIKRRCKKERKKRKEKKKKEKRKMKLEKKKRENTSELGEGGTIALKIIEILPQFSFDFLLYSFLISYSASTSSSFSQTRLKK